MILVRVTCNKTRTTHSRKPEAEEENVKSRVRPSTQKTQSIAKMQGRRYTNHGYNIHYNLKKVSANISINAFFHRLGSLELINQSYRVLLFTQKLHPTIFL